MRTTERSVTMAKSPEDDLFDALWPDESRSNPMSFKAGEIYVSATEPVVWLPFLVLLVIGWVALAVLLPPDLAAQFIDLTLGSLVQTLTEFSISVLGRLLANLIGLMFAFYLYTWVFRIVVGGLVKYTEI